MAIQGNTSNNLAYYGTELYLFPNPPLDNFQNAVSAYADSQQNRTDALGTSYYDTSGCTGTCITDCEAGNNFEPSGKKICRVYFSKHAIVTHCNATPNFIPDSVKGILVYTALDSTSNFILCANPILGGGGDAGGGSKGRRSDASGNINLLAVRQLYGAFAANGFQKFNDAQTSTISWNANELLLLLGKTAEFADPNLNLDFEVIIQTGAQLGYSPDPNKLFFNLGIKSFVNNLDILSFGRPCPTYCY